MKIKPKIANFYKRICHPFCKLCKVASGKGTRTKVYYEDKQILLIQDINPNNALFRVMGLWKKHKKYLTVDEEKYLIEIMVCEMDKVELPYFLEKTMFSHPRHPHLHSHFFGTEKEKEIYIEKWKKIRNRIIFYTI